MLIHSFALNDIDLNNVINIGMVFIDKHVKYHNYPKNYRLWLNYNSKYQSGQQH